MNRQITHTRVFLAAGLVLALGCAANPPAQGGGSGGADNGAGGAPAGTGGMVASTGGAGTMLLLGMGGHPFPQNKKPGNCTLTTVSNASGAAQSAYNSWKNAFVTSSGAGNGLRVRRPVNSDDTVSEGIGYGMIAAVYIGDRSTFDGLWTYAKAHFDKNGLMNWQIPSSGVVANPPPGSASDGDVDMTWALIMASEQWSTVSYLDEAKKLIAAMYAFSISGDGMLRPGDGWGSSTIMTNPSYFSPAYFRVFAVASGNAFWSGPAIDRNYQIVEGVSGTQGLVPDWTTNAAVVNQGNLMNNPSLDNNSYGYDACRTPWRIAMDYCLNGEPRAKAYLMKVGSFFNGVGANNIADKYGLSGTSKGSGDKNMAFIGTAGTAAMAGFPTLLDGAFAYGAGNTAGDYFKDSLRVITMLMMSGNMPDFTKP